MRRLLALLRALPAESELATLERGRPLQEVWTVEREMAAATIDLLGIIATERHRLRKPATWKRPAQVRAGHGPAVAPADAARQLAAAGMKVRAA